MTASRAAHLARWIAPAFVVAGGIIHLDLWFGGYRGIPIIGPLFLVNFVVSVALGAALSIRGGGRLILLALAFSGGSLAALVMSRTVGLLGFSESWSSQAVLALFLELGATLLLASSLVARRRPALAR